ncbi:L-lactate dehydrogenase [Candidatus Collierbacteria bacterium]|nr:L-lactate dehydrogenase [Candidatus Collierbacteria bacterium]
MSETGSFKVGVVGCGKVGMTAAFAMMLSGTPTDIVLVDRNKEKALGEKLDLEHAMSLMTNYVTVVGTDDYNELVGAKLIVYTAGISQIPGQTRLDLVNTNKKILEEILPKTNQAAPEAVILIVANPVDVLTFWANRIITPPTPPQKPHPDPLLGKERGEIRVFGSGTMLDTARFRFHLSELLRVNPHSIHAYVLGEHGDTSFPVYAKTTIGGQKLLDLPGINEEMIVDAYKKTRDAAYKIIEAKGATYYAIGVVVTKIMQAIFSDSKTVYPLSVPLSGVAISVPCVLGENGVEKILEVDLSEAEKEKMRLSVEVLKPYCQ